MKKTVISFLCASISVYSGLYAQNASTAKQDSTKSLADSIKIVTITATRTEKDVMDVGRSVSVITPDQIKRAGCNTVAELLSQQEGIFIDGTGQNPGAIQSLFLRGADDNNTAIMIDGVPLNDPTTDAGELDLSELSLADVDRIEIVRGSHSTLYGSSSIGGVINIITKKSYKPGLHASASVTGGEFGSQSASFDGNIMLNYTFKNGFYVAGGCHRYTDKGLNATVDTIAHPLSYQMNPDRDNFQQTAPFAKIGFNNKNWNIYAEYRNVNQAAGIDAAAFEDAKNASNQFVRDFYTGGITYTVNSNFNIQYTGALSHDYRIVKQGWDTIDSYGDLSTYSDTYTATYMTHNVKAEYDYKTSHFIIGGGTYNESMTTSATTIYNYGGSLTTYGDTPDSVEFKQTTNDFYAQADINGGTFNTAWSPFSLLLGMRATSNSIFGNNVSYELNPYYKVNPNTTLYLSYSTGFTTPSLYELFSPDRFGDNPATSFTLGNSKLSAETSTSFEVGIKHRVSNNLFFTLAWFETEVNNHIDYVALWNKSVPIDSLAYGDNNGYTYLNLGQEITQGFELSMFLKLSPKLDFTGNISLLSTTLKYNQSNVDTSQTHNNWVQVYDGGVFLNGSSQSTGLLRRPGALGNFSIIWHPVKKLALTLRARYVGTRFDAQYDNNLGPYGAIGFVNVGDYTLLDAYASYDITNNFSVTARCENIFNTVYSEILGYTTLGRSGYLNLRYTF